MRTTKTLLAAFALGVGLLTATGANAALMTQTLTDGSSAILDNVSNSYWYPYLGDFKWTFNNVTNGTAYLNSADYFGINDWHLASVGEVSNLFTNNGGNAIASNFSYNFQSSGTLNYGYTSTICHPWSGCYTVCILGPCGSTNYTATHWYGIYDSTSTVAEIVTVPDPNLFCGFFPYPPCNPTSTTVYHPAHDAIDLIFTEYQNNIPSFYSQGTDLSIDDGTVITGTSPMYGAWVVGTLTTTRVPEPPTLLLLVAAGIGLAGALARTRRSNHAMRRQI